MCMCVLCTNDNNTICSRNYPDPYPYVPLFLNLKPSKRFLFPYRSAQNCYSCYNPRMSLLSVVSYLYHLMSVSHICSFLGRYTHMEWKGISQRVRLIWPILHPNYSKWRSWRKDVLLLSSHISSFFSLRCEERTQVDEMWRQNYPNQRPRH